MVGGLIKASAMLASHRGCQPGRHLAELADLLVGKPPVQAMPESPVARSTRPQAMAKPRMPRLAAGLPPEHEACKEVSAVATVVQRALFRDR